MSDLKISIVYDNTALPGFKADWGFSALIEFNDTPTILFDTGANGEILLENMHKMKISPSIIDEIFISHDHWDHTGGLSAILQKVDAPIYVPESFSTPVSGKLIRISKRTKIHEEVFSTGELSGIEQSLVLNTNKGLVVLVGCSHPGVDEILKAASHFGKPYALVGGLHGFNKFNVLKDLSLVCPTHCTQHKEEIKSLYPEKYVSGGAGTILEL